MSKCDIYFKSKVPVLEIPLIKLVTEQEFKQELYQTFPLLNMSEKEFESTLNIIDKFYVCFGGFYYKLKDSVSIDSPIL